MYFNGLDTKLILILASIIGRKNWQDINTQSIPFYTIYINYNHKLLARIRMLAVF